MFDFFGKHPVITRSQGKAVGKGHHPLHPTAPQWVKNRGFRVPVSHKQEEDEG